MPTNVVWLKHQLALPPLMPLRAMILVPLSACPVTSNAACNEMKPGVSLNLTPSSADRVRPVPEQSARRGKAQSAQQKAYTEKRFCAVARRPVPRQIGKYNMYGRHWDIRNNRDVVVSGLAVVCCLLKLCFQAGHLLPDEGSSLLLGHAQHLIAHCRVLRIEVKNVEFVWKGIIQPLPRENRESSITKPWHGSSGSMHREPL